MEDWVTIAHLKRARGNRGELCAEPLSGRTVEGYRQLRSVALVPPSGPAGDGRLFEIEAVWEHRTKRERLLVFKFRGIDTISDAEKLAGCEVRIPPAERAALPADEFYHSDLIGCTLVDRTTGQTVGQVTGVEEYGGPVLLKVKAPEGEVLVPFARSICSRIDLKERRIVADLPEGLSKLNE